MKNNSGKLWFWYFGKLWSGWSGLRTSAHRGPTAHVTMRHYNELSKETFATAQNPLHPKGPPLTNEI
jgi:hypothetical protein